MNISCKRCHSQCWEYTDTITTMVDFNKNRLDASEIARTNLRCARCGHKATLLEAAAIRATSLFQPLSNTKDFNDYDLTNSNLDTLSGFQDVRSSDERGAVTTSV